MNDEIKKLWVDDLRANADKQGRDALDMDGKQCCLGRLCLLAVQAGVITTSQRPNSSRTHFGPYGEANYLPYEVQTWAGLDDYNPQLRIDGELREASWHNDGGKSFLQIADAIEEQL